MARIRLNLKNLTIPEKIAKGRQIVTAMTNNTTFANPIPALLRSSRLRGFEGVEDYGSGGYRFGLPRACLQLQ